MEKDIVAIHEKKIKQAKQNSHNKKVSKVVRGVEKNVLNGKGIIKPWSNDEYESVVSADVFNDAQSVLSEKGVSVEPHSTRSYDGYYNRIVVTETQDPSLYENIIVRAEVEAHDEDRKRTKRIEDISDYVLKKVQKGKVEINAKTGLLSKTHLVKGNELAVIQANLSDQGISIEPAKRILADENPGTLLKVTHVQIDK